MCQMITAKDSIIKCVWKNMIVKRKKLNIKQLYWNIITNINWRYGGVMGGTVGSDNGPFKYYVVGSQDS